MATCDVSVDVKACSRCGEVKSLGEFCCDKRNPDGRGGACLACERERSRRGYREIPGRRAHILAAGKKWRAENPERQRESQRRQYWADPDHHRARKRAWDAQNRDLVNQRARERYRRDWADPVKRARMLERIARRRAVIEAGSTPELIAAMAAMYEVACTYCGATEGIEVDHIYPLARGGRHELRNLTPACGFCNRSKKDRLLSEWVGVIV